MKGQIPIMVNLELYNYLQDRNNYPEYSNRSTYIVDLILQDKSKRENRKYEKEKSRNKK